MYMYLLSLLISLCSLTAGIIDTADLSVIQEELVPGALVVFDIDNTIAHPAGVVHGDPLGSDQWFTMLIQDARKLGLSMNEAIQYVLPLYWHVQQTIALVPVDATIPQLIKNLQAREGIYVIALTARSFPMVDITIQQLRDIDIDFSFGHPFSHNMIIDLEFPALCRNGIIFNGNNNKGEVLHAFARANNHVPSKVIFVDDKLSNLQHVQTACDAYGIEFVGIRYAGADAYVTAFNCDDAHSCLSRFFERYRAFCCPSVTA